MTCPHDPAETRGPIGMYHCPECGEMVLAGSPHPDYSRPFDEADHAIIEGRACLWFPGYRGEDSADPEAPQGWPDF